MDVLEEQTAILRNLDKLVQKLIDEGPYVDEGVDEFLMQCQLALDLNDPLTLEEQEKLACLMNVHLRPPTFTVRYPEGPEQTKGLSVVIRNRPAVSNQGWSNRSNSRFRR